MRLAALYSGGKDSSLALYLAAQMGHEIAYLINIIPSNGNSWIFHVPNVKFVPFMSDALNIPLVTAETDGTEEGDIMALENVLEGLDVNGIVVGTLWSDYQWDRINRVLGKMNLVMIAPLWRKNQSIIYDEMLAAGIDSIIVGVFADGFNKNWLGRHIDKGMKKELLALNKKYGISIMGEGGEYESFTLDSPVHRKKLKILEHNVEFRNSSGTYEIISIELENK